MLKILQNLETVTVCDLLIWPTPWIKEHRKKMISFFLQLTVVSYRNIKTWSQGCNVEVGTESKTVNSTYWFVSSVFLSNTVILHLPYPSCIIHLSRKWHHSLACSPVWLKYFFPIEIPPSLVSLAFNLVIEILPTYKCANCDFIIS